MPERPVNGATPVCPDLETIGAFAEGTLDARERAAVEAHVAECEDCYELVTEVMRSADMTSAATLTAGPPGAAPAAADGAVAATGAKTARRRLWVLAVAAMLLLAVFLQPSWWRRFASPQSPQLADIVAIVGVARTFDARVSGLPYEPPRPPTRSIDKPADLRVRALLAELEADTRARRSPAAVHLLGVSRLLAGDLDGAIDSLERAAQMDPHTARFHSDLSAAYLTRGVSRDRRDDVTKARDAAEGALRLEPAFAEAMFNRAIALEALGDRSAAESAWEVYLATDAGSSWSAEARQRLTDLRRTGGAPGSN